LPKKWTRLELRERVQRRKLEPRFDSIETEKPLGANVWLASGNFRRRTRTPAVRPNKAMNLNKTCRGFAHHAKRSDQFARTEGWGHEVWEGISSSNFADPKHVECSLSSTHHE